jgi:hypothetical protein
MHGNITSGSFRDMGKLIRATLGLVIALTLLNGEGLWARLGSPALLAVKADIAAHPAKMTLDSSLDSWLPSGNGTHSAPIPHGAQARGLHI